MICIHLYFFPANLQNVLCHTFKLVFLLMTKLI